MINQLTMKIQFQDFPASNSQDYNILMKKISDGVRENKHKIVNMQADASDKAYYAFQTDLYNKLAGNKEITLDVSPKEIPYDMYKRFSEDYGLSVDMSVGKYGHHVLNCNDKKRPEYYNAMNTHIQDGQIVSRVFSHIDPDGVCKEGSSLPVPKSDINKSFVDLYSALYDGSFMPDAVSLNDFSVNEYQTEEDFENVY